MSEAITSNATSFTRQSALRVALWAGIVGPFLFVVVFTVDGFFTPGYDAMRDVVSFLELGQAGWIQRLNFIVTGLLFVLFALGFYSARRPRKRSGWLVVTTALIALSGLGLVMAGPFLPDPPGSAQVTLQGDLHTISFSVVFLSLGLACVFVGGSFIRTPGWRIHGWYSLLAGLFPIFAAWGNLYSSFVVSNASNTAFTATTSQLAVGGLINRVLIVVAFAWYVILAIRLLLQTRAVETRSI